MEHHLESDPVFRQHREKRARLYERLDRVRGEVDVWLDEHVEKWPGLTDLAQLEALHAEKEQILTEFLQAENTFIDHVLRLRRNTD